MKTALISVSDKGGIVDFAKKLRLLGFQIISTGGTFDTLTKNGVDAIPVDSVTGFPECLGGRVKTLHPKIHGGILARRDNKKHMEQVRELDIGLIDLIVVNLYPFKETILKPGVTMEEAIENIDIGGPAMVRSGAKNYKDTAVITDPKDYTPILEEIEEKGNLCVETRFRLSAKAFLHTAHYDTMISDYLKPLSHMEIFPPTMTMTFEKYSDLPYGENPHQKAAYYTEVTAKPAYQQLHGKALSFNNINDTSGALRLLSEFSEPAAVAVKHACPCGVAISDNICGAYTKAYFSDPVSIFGGIVALNRPVDINTANELSKTFLEVVAAPDFSPEALDLLGKKKNLRILKVSKTENTDKNQLDYKRTPGGLLVQEEDSVLLNGGELSIVTNVLPTENEIEDLLFAFKVVKHVKSNGIAITKDKQTQGIGNGQVSRIWALEQAIDHSREFFGEAGLKGSVLASDAFFPFSDCVEAAHKAGIKAIIQPGGSIRDEDSIKLCNKYGISMAFTGMRHFRH